MSDSSLPYVLDVNEQDLRGPERIIVALTPTIRLSCGHTPDLNPIFSRRVGDRCRCFACGPAASLRGVR